MGELVEELRQLHEESHPPKQPGEFSVLDYSVANGLTLERASKELDYMATTGEVIKIPHKRFIDGHMRKVFMLVKKP